MEASAGRHFCTPETGNYDPTRTKFIQGKVAFYLQGSGHHPLIQKEALEAGFEVGYAPLPTLALGQQAQEKYAFPLGGAAIWVFQTAAKNEKSSEEVSSVEMNEVVKGVREFLNYLASMEVQAKWHMETAYVPVSKSARQMLQQIGFYDNHPVHKAVVEQTHDAPLGENSFGHKEGRLCFGPKETISID